MEINPEYSLEGLMLKLKLQYFGHLMRRADSLEKTLMLEKIEGKRRKGLQRMRWLDSITNSMNMNLSKIQEIVKFRQAWHAAFHGVTKSQTWLSNWTTATSFPRSLRLPNKLLQAPDWGVFLGAHSMLTCCHPPSADTPNCLWFTVPMGALKMKWSHSVVCDSLQPQILQHRLPCPSLFPRVCSASCSLSWWCYLTTSSSATLFSRLQSFPASGSFPMSQYFISGGQSVGASASVLPVNIQCWFPL